MLTLFTCLFFFFFNDTATTEIYTLSLHDALPISSTVARISDSFPVERQNAIRQELAMALAAVLTQILDRKSTRLNSSHSQISYAVFCLKKKKKKTTHYRHTTTTTYNVHIQHCLQP